MPPHCDSLDGPVVNAAREALTSQDVDVVLPYVPKEGEEEVRRAFDSVVSIRDRDPAVCEVADRHFFETVVRIHRAGEGAPFTGLKPAGLDHGPVIPIAERALQTGSPDELMRLLTGAVEEEVRDRLEAAMKLKAAPDGSVDSAREYTEAMLSFQVWAHKLYLATRAPAHGAHHEG